MNLESRESWSEHQERNISAFQTVYKICLDPPPSFLEHFGKLQSM